MTVEEPASALNNLSFDLDAVVGGIGHGSSSLRLREVCLDGEDPATKILY